jgi:hypothetical protein
VLDTYATLRLAASRSRIVALSITPTLCSAITDAWIEVKASLLCLFSSFTLTTTTEIKQNVIAARVAAIHGSACGIQQDNSTLVDEWITATRAVMCGNDTDNKINLHTRTNPTSFS